MSIEAIDFSVPWLTTEQMVEVDRLMIEDLGIELIQMMENAGRNLASLARERFLAGDPNGKTVVVLAGTGGNGGGALVCARRLVGWGARVEVVLSRSSEAFGSVPGRQLLILPKMGGLDIRRFLANCSGESSCSDMDRTHVGRSSAAREPLPTSETSSSTIIWPFSPMMSLSFRFRLKHRFFVSDLGRVNMLRTG